MRICLFVCSEILNCGWQIYGNVIFWQNAGDAEHTCNKKNNSGFFVSMLLMLIIGYIYFLFYIVLISLLGFLFCRRFNRSRAAQAETRRLMSSISRVQFSEELFGAISEENECVICMTAFTEEDTITKLDCGGGHFYHTACIEDWLKTGNSQCPMCRQPITGPAV